MSRLLCLSIISATAAGCSGDTCGPEGAPAIGVVASTTGLTLTYGTMNGGLNNDCPEPSAPDGIVSMTVMGTQDGGSGLFNICIPRPDLLATEAQPLGAEVPNSPQVRVTDITGMANNCTFKLDSTKPITGTATSTGLCGNGADSAGFALVLDGMVTLKRTCGATIDSVDVALRGRVAVVTKK